jgi:hypothetical protein
MGSPTISSSKILQAAGGNPALLELLQQISHTTAQQQAATGTTPVSGSQATKSATAPVPPQASGTVSVVAGIYTVQIVNPGGTSPLSQLQAAAQSSVSLQPTTAIFHQVRASTSPAFNLNSNTQTFGGDTGSTQTMWTLNGLGAGTWYFQFRSSYDGVNFNQWKNGNGGNAFGGLVDQVSLVTAAFSDWALFSYPGKGVMGIVQGQLHDQEVLGIPSGYNLFSSGLIAIAGPNGFDPNGNGVAGLAMSDVNLEVPAGGGQGQTGIPDYPVQIRMLYQSNGYTSPGSAAVFGFAFDPEGTNVKLYTGGTGAVWATFVMPGGARIAIGMGKDVHGATIWTPPVSWFDPSRMMSICSLTDVNPTSPIPIEGIYQAQLSGLTVEAQYQLPAGTPVGGTTANWMAIAWELGAPVQTVGGFPFLTIPLQGGHAMVIGAGQTASGSTITLPTGFSAVDMLSIGTPGGTTHTGNHLRGIQSCQLFGTLVQLLYTDDSNIWGGPVNWMVAAWK